VRYFALKHELVDEKKTTTSSPFFFIESSFFEELDSFDSDEETQEVQELDSEFVKKLNGVNYQIPLVVIDQRILEPKPIENQTRSSVSKPEKPISKPDLRFPPEVVMEVDDRKIEIPKVKVSVVLPDNLDKERLEQQEKENRRKQTSDLALAILAGENRLIPIEIAAEITGADKARLFRLHKDEDLGEYLGGMVLFTLGELESHFEVNCEKRLEDLIRWDESDNDNELANAISRLEQMHGGADLAKLFLRRYAAGYLGVAEAMGILNLGKSRLRKLASEGRIGTLVSGRYLFTKKELEDFSPNPRGISLKK